MRFARLQNTGKTTTIKKVYEVLKRSHPNSVVREILNRKEITIIIIIDDVKIGIESQGDPNSRLEESLKTFVEAGCDIIICATRTKGMTVDAVNRLAGRYHIEWLDKQDEPRPADQNPANDEFAQRIVESIESELAAAS